MSDTAAAEGTDLYVKPVFQEKEASWVIELDLPADDDSNLNKSVDEPAPEDVSLPSTTPSTPPAFPIPKDSFTKVRVMYAGAEGTFAIPEDNVYFIQDYTMRVAQASCFVGIRCLVFSCSVISFDQLYSSFDSYHYNMKIEQIPYPYLDIM